MYQIYVKQKRALQPEELFQIHYQDSIINSKFYGLVRLTKKNGCGIITRHSQKNSIFAVQQILEN